uniref:RRM domain-containing protein n=1 Tax=Angiostrongylus cantonensis TaxID=6313 RepID=A0A0K0DE30_ANGCA
MVVVVASPPQSQPRGATSTHLSRDVVGRESRHVYISGLPESVSDDHIISSFSKLASFGRVHQLERTTEGFVVSFMDVRSAQKAYAGDHRLESGVPFRITFHEPGMKKRSPDSVNYCAVPSGSCHSSTSASMPTQSSGGLQGVYVERLPPRSDGTVKEAIRDALKKHGRIVDISIEGDGDSRKALVIFQRVIDMEKLVNDSHISILSMRVRIRAASHVVVQEAYNDYLSLNSPAGGGAMVTSLADLPAKYASPNCSRNEVDVFHPKASRTLYVGGLESRISDDTLRRRFGKYGLILDVDVKNYESPSPFAFIQFADIESAVRAINAHSSSVVHANRKGKKFQPNFGRSMTTNKLWIGSIPPQIGEDYVIQKLRSLSEGVVDVVVDMRVRQAIVVFSSTEGAQAALNRIKAGVPKQFVFKVESGEARVPADFCSDRLHDHFIDRKHGGVPVKIQASSTACTASADYIAVSTPTVQVDDSLTAFLAPPPDPPSDMISYRYEHHRDQRRSPAHSKRRERSLERTRHRRSSKYDYDKGSSRRKEKDRKLRFYDDVSRPPLDPPPAPPPMEALSQNPSPPPADPPIRRKTSPRTSSQSRSTPAFVSPPSTSHHDSHSIRHQNHHCSHEPQSVSSQHRHHSLSSGPEPSTAASCNLNTPGSQKRHSVDGQPSVTRPHSTSTSSQRSRTGKWPWNELLRNPCVFFDTANISLPDPRLSRSEYCRVVSSHLPLPPFWNSDRHPRSVAGEWRKRSSGSAASVDGVQSLSQRRTSSNVGIASACRSHVTSSDERPHLHTHISGYSNAQHHATVSRSSSSSGASGALDSDAQLSPDAAPLPPPPPSALDLLCEPDDIPILADGWSGRLAEIGSRLTDVNASLEEAHRGVAELDEHHHRRPSTSTIETTPTSSRQRQSGVLGVTPRTDSFEERLRSINQKKKSSFDDFTLNITQERILAAKASAPDPLSVTSFSGISSGSGLSSSGFSRNTTLQRLAPALSITIPQLGSGSQSTATTPASNRLDSPLSSRKSGTPCTTASAPLPSSSTLPASSSTPPIRLAAPPTAPVIAYPPNFSVPPPNFPVTPPFVYAPSTTPDSQTSPIISAPPPPPQLPPTVLEPTTHRDNSLWKSPTITSGNSFAFKCGGPTRVSNSRLSQDAVCQQDSAVQTPHQTSLYGMPGPSQPSPVITALASHFPQPAPLTTSGASKTLSHNKTTATPQRTGEKHLAPRHDGVSAIKSPVYGSISTLAGKPLSASDNRKCGVAPIAHKDPSTELLAELFHNKPPTTDFRKLPKIEKKPSASSTHAEKDHANQEQLRKISSAQDHYRKEKEHKLHRKKEGLFETKEERAKRKDVERAKREREREKLKDQKREKKVKEERKKSKDEEKEKKERRARKVEKERQREKKSKKQKKKSRASSSDDDSSSEDSDYQKAFSKQMAHLVAEDSGSSCAGASGGLSMYDRVKRRSSAANKDERTKKTAALQKLRDKNNEKKSQKRHRIQLDSSDEEEHEGNISMRKVVDSEIDVSSEDDNQVTRRDENQNVDSSEDEGKNVNMDDVFGADSTDDEAIVGTEDMDKKRKKSRKESSDEDEVPKKKSGKSERLDFQSIFGPDKPEKGRKRDKDKKDKKHVEEEMKDCKKDIAKRKGDIHDIKPAKRQKKCHQSYGTSASEEESQNASHKSEENKIKCIVDEKVDLEIVKDEVLDEKSGDNNLAATPSKHRVRCEDDLEEEKKLQPSSEMDAKTTSTPTILPTSLISEHSRPKLLTKAAMKIFVPSQSAVATSTVSTTQPSTEADSDNSTDYDDVFASTVSESNSGQQCASIASHVPVRRVSTSSSATTEPEDATESDSDSQRSRHHAVELVDAAAGYASVYESSAPNVGDVTAFDEAGTNEDSSPRNSIVSSKCKDVDLVGCCAHLQNEHKALVSPAATEMTCTFEQTAVNGEPGKAANSISDVQETEDAVKSIFDGDDEEEEPQYPTLVFVPGKNGAVVASAGLTSAGEATLSSTSVGATNEETSREVDAISDVDGGENANVASGDVSDEQLLRESFVEEPILEEKLAIEKVEAPCSVKERPSTELSSNVVQLDDDDDIVVVPCSDTLKEHKSSCSISQPPGSHGISPITVAIPDRKVSTPLLSPKTSINADHGTFVQPSAMHPLKVSPVSSSVNVSVLSSSSPAPGAITLGTSVVSQGSMHQIYNRFQQPSFTNSSVLQQQQTYQQAQAQQRPLSQQHLFQQQLAAQQMALQHQQQQILAQQQLEIQQHRERERDREITFQKERDLQQHREREIQQQLQQQIFQQQQHQKETGATSRVVKSQTPATAMSPAPHPTTPVSQQAALAAQTLKLQLQQMQMIQMASRDSIGYFQQMSQTFGQPVATALLAQIQALQQLPTSQAQQFLIELQRQQIKAQQEASSTASPSPQPIQQERERLIKESQLRAIRERDALHQHHAQSTQQQQAAALYAYRLTQQQLLSQQGAAQTSPSVCQPSGSVFAGTISQERKNIAVPSQLHPLENVTQTTVLPSSSAAIPSPSGISSSGHSADVAKHFLTSSPCKFLRSYWMSSNGSQPRTAEIGVKRSRKAAEPQHLSSFCISSPEETMNPSSTIPLTGDAQDISEHASNILNLAGAIAMNSLLAINQQATIGGFLTNTHLAAQNPLLVNAAKMVLSMNLVNATENNVERPSASNSASELLSQITSHPDVTAQSLTSLQKAALFQKYAVFGRSQAPNDNPPLAAVQTSLMRTTGSESSQQNDRKRSFPSAEISSHVVELRKRVYSDTSALNAQRKSGRFSFPHVPVSKDDMERCLNRILNEEIYNIYEEDVKPDQKAESPASSPEDKRAYGSRSPCLPAERKLSIDEILSIIASRQSTKKESGIASLGSAFRKVSGRPHNSDSISHEVLVSDSPLAWSTSVSPASSSPRGSETEVTPISQEIINQLHDLAISHREADPDNLSNEKTLTREEQLKRFPVVWQGTLAMKHSETTVQMHLVYGSVEMLTRCLGDANADAKNAVVIRVNQRMRLEHAQVQVAGMVAKMSDAGRFACMICLPCGPSRDEIITNSDIFRTAFIEYFASKQAAGIAVMPQTETTTGCLVHVFPPGDFPSSYLQYYSPQLYESITTRQALFLFVVLTPDESSRPFTS